MGIKQNASQLLFTALHLENETAAHVMHVRLLSESFN